MGWINLKNRNITPKVEFQFEEGLKATTENVENVSLNEYSRPQRYPFVSPKVSDSQLPFIPATEVRKGTSSEVGGLRKTPSIPSSMNHSLTGSSNSDRRNSL